MEGTRSKHRETVLESPEQYEAAWSKSSTFFYQGNQQGRRAYGKKSNKGAGVIINAARTASLTTERKKKKRAQPETDDHPSSCLSDCESISSFDRNMAAKNEEPLRNGGPPLNKLQSTCSFSSSSSDAAPYPALITTSMRRKENANPNLLPPKSSTNGNRKETVNTNGFSSSGKERSRSYAKKKKSSPATPDQTTPNFSSSFSSNNSSFSSLAQQGESAHSWVFNNSCQDQPSDTNISGIHHGNMYLADIYHNPVIREPSMSPMKFSSDNQCTAMAMSMTKTPVVRQIRSPSSSSRKRMTPSPIMSGTTMISIRETEEMTTRRTSSSLKSRRSRARSRIFVPVAGDVHDSDVKMRSEQKKANARRCDFRHKTEENHYDTDEDEKAHCSSSSSSSSLSSPSVEYGTKKTSLTGIAQPSRLIRRSASTGFMVNTPPKPLRRTNSNDNFEMAVFGSCEKTVEHHVLSAPNANKQPRIAPRLQDLKYLIKILKKDLKHRTQGTCTVILNSNWTQEHKTFFLRWANHELGMVLRNMGGNELYASVSFAKAKQILKMAEKDLKALEIKLKDKSHKKKELVSPGIEMKKRKNSKPPVCFITFKKMEPEGEQNIDTRTTPHKSHISSDVPPTLTTSKNDNELLKSFNTLKITNIDNTDTKVPQHEVTKGEKSTIHGANNRNSIDSLLNISNEEQNMFLQCHSSASCADVVSYSHRTSPALNKSRRSSMFASYGDTFDGQNSLMGNDLKHEFCSGFGSSPFSCNRILPDLRPTAMAGSFETPMLKQGHCRYWGSRPIPNRDWGSSTPCPSSVSESLIKLFEDAFFEKVNSENPSAMFYPSQNNSCFETTAYTREVKTGNLGFDDESCGGEHFSAGEDESEAVENGGNVEASAVVRLDLGDDCEKDDDVIQEKKKKRRQKSLAKRSRMSICASSMEFAMPMKTNRFSIYGYQSVLDNVQEGREDTICLQPASFNDCCSNECNFLSMVFSHFGESDLFLLSAVCSEWAEAAADAHAKLMLISVGCPTSFISDEDEDDVESDEEECSVRQNASELSVMKSMDRSWSFINTIFPWGCFLSEGAFKRVYKVWNSTVNAEEAVSVMDIDLIDSMGNKSVIGAELAVSVLLSSLVRRNICPNFVLTRGVFTSIFEPAASCWGSAKKKYPRGKVYNHKSRRKPTKPKKNGKFQFIRMELCRNGDIEEFIKDQPKKILDINLAQSMLFQMAFSLHAAADKFSLKHYDVKLLNFFLQSDDSQCTRGKKCDPSTILRYGVGSHVFNLKMKTEECYIAKLADYGTANIQAESNGRPVTIAQFTTLENTPPDYLLLGDLAEQGHSHDAFGLGLCMLHLFTGHGPYEEILADVTCPPNLKKKLEKIWEADATGYDVIRSVILADVYEDDEGNVEGVPDQVLYDTLYRYLVLFGIPKKKWKSKGDKVWRAISSSLEQKNKNHIPPEKYYYDRDCRRYMISKGTDKRIVTARHLLTQMEGGMELLLSLVKFDPEERATPLDVVNSTFMANLRKNVTVKEHDTVKDYMAYAIP